MNSYRLGQIAANILFILIPLYYIARKKSSKRTKTIAKVILAVVVLGLIGQLGTHFEKQAVPPQKTAAIGAAQVDTLSSQYASPDGSFTASFPQYPNATTSTQNDSGVQVQNNTYTASNSSNDTKYSVETLTYPQYTDYMRDHQRQMLQQIMQQVNDSYTAKVTSAGNNGQYLCGFSAYKESFTYTDNGVTYKGYALAALDYNNFYVLINYGQNTATFSNFVKSFVPKGGCNYSTVL
jgi:hypothetical protein